MTQLSILLLGFSWKIARCPICGQPLGWIWEPNENLEKQISRPDVIISEPSVNISEPDVNTSKPEASTDEPRTRFYSLRLDKVLDPGSRFLGPALEIPALLKSIWNKIG